MILSTPSGLSYSFDSYCMFRNESFLFIFFIVTAVILRLQQVILVSVMQFYHERSLPLTS